MEGSLRPDTQSTCTRSPQRRWQDTLLWVRSPKEPCITRNRLTFHKKCDAAPRPRVLTEQRALGRLQRFCSHGLVGFAAINVRGHH